MRGGLPETQGGFDEDEVGLDLGCEGAAVGHGDLAMVAVEGTEVNLFGVLEEIGVGEQAFDVVGGAEMLHRSEVGKIEVELQEPAGGAVIAFGDLVGFLGGLGAGVAVHLEVENDAADFSADALEFDPLAGGESGRGVVVVKLDIDVRGAGVFLLLDKLGVAGGLAGGNEAEEVAKTVLFGEPAVLGGQARRDAVETGRGDGFNFALERPFAGGRGMADERPEVGDVG